MMIIFEAKAIKYQTPKSEIRKQNEWKIYKNKPTSPNTHNENGRAHIIE